MNDITDFMTWFLGQVVSLFGDIFSLLDSITFMGTSLLKVLLTILILGSLIGVVLTIGKSTNYVVSRSERVDRKNQKKGDD